jgi:putative serine protease PepD
MKVPRHLWAGNWREESERARAELAGATPPPAAPQDTPPPDVPAATEADIAATQAPAAGQRRPIRPVAACVAAAAIGAGAYMVGTNHGSDSPSTPAALPAVAARPVKAPAGQTRAGIIYSRTSPAVVSIRTSSGSGTGFLVQDARTVVTNAHVVQSASQVTVRFGAEGRDLTGQVLGTDSSSDLAVVRIPAGSAPAGAQPLALADSNQVAVGDDVIAIGNPFGLDRTATEGIVSGLGREIRAPNGFEISDAIQTDAPINPGNSGGPLLDVTGRVIGVNSQIETGGTQSGNLGIGFAVPSNSIRQVVPQLARGRTIAHAWLGVETATSASGSGAQVRGVTAGGPAQDAGIRAGDTLLSIGGTPVHNFSGIAAAVNAHKPGDAVDVRVSRGGRTVTIRVKLGTRPSQAP